MTITARYKGSLVIGDNLYLEQENTNPRMKELIFSGEFDSNVDVDVIDINDDYPVAVASIHFYNDKKQLEFDMVEETLKTTEGLEYSDKQLGCDTASFEIIGKNQESIHTLSDGYYGYVFQASTGETIITFYVTHDSMDANQLMQSIKFALGI